MDVCSVSLACYQHVITVQSVNCSAPRMPSLRLGCVSPGDGQCASLGML